VEDHLKAATSQEIISRMLRNLLSPAEQRHDTDSMLRYVNAMVAVDEADIEARGKRAILRYQAGDRAAAVHDLDWFLANEPTGLDLDAIRAMRAKFLSGANVSE
jgi:regulator of sirC expression with transglutaminase-like and TPR domain